MSHQCLDSIISFITIIFLALFFFPIFFFYCYAMWGALWHLQWFLQYIVLEFSPSTTSFFLHFLCYNPALPISLFPSIQISICLAFSSPLSFLSPNYCFFTLCFHSFLQLSTFSSHLPLPFTLLLLPPPHLPLSEKSTVPTVHITPIHRIALQSLTEAPSPQQLNYTLTLKNGPPYGIAHTSYHFLPSTCPPFLPSS
jgi:hypothetical protein